MISKLEVTEKTSFKKYIYNILKNWADFFNNHYIIKTVILFIPSIWLSFIVKYYGNYWGIADGQNNLTKRGLALTWALSLAVLFINALSSYKARRDKDYINSFNSKIQLLDDNLDVYDKLLDSTYKICDTKHNTLSKFIEVSINLNQVQQPFNNTAQPLEQLQKIGNEISECFHNITKIKNEHIIVSMAYQMKEIKSEWRWVDYTNLHGCEKLNVLLSNPHSTLYQICNKKEEFIFHNSKQEAFEDGNYIYDLKDNKHKRIGSIICMDISVGTQDKVVGRIILSISTYGKQIVADNDKKKVENVTETLQHILRHFEKRISIELSCLFIKEYYACTSPKD